MTEKARKNSAAPRKNSARDVASAAIALKAVAVLEG
jgi:hypothetical protein